MHEQVQVENYETNIEELRDKNTNIFVKYKNTQEKRIEYENKIKELIIKYNKTIVKEEEYLKQQIEIGKEIDIKLKEKQMYVNGLISSNEIVKDCCDFTNKNASKVSEMNQFINDQWKLQEKKWYEWNTKDVLIWFKHQLVQYDNDIDWNPIETKMNTSKFRGDHLLNVSKELKWLENLGFVSMDAQMVLFDSIKLLISNNPKPKSKLSVKMCKDLLYK